jgi:WD40 repeat protein
VSGSRDRTIRVWDLQTYACLAAYWTDSRIDCIPGLAFNPFRIIIGDEAGKLHFLQWEGEMPG